MDCDAALYEFWVMLSYLLEAWLGIVRSLPGLIGLLTNQKFGVADSPYVSSLTPSHCDCVTEFSPKKGNSRIKQQEQ